MSAQPKRFPRQDSGGGSHAAPEVGAAESVRNERAAASRRSDFDMDAWEPSLLAKLLGIDNDAEDGIGQD